MLIKGWLTTNFTNTGTTNRWRFSTIRNARTKSCSKWWWFAW